MGLRDFEAYSLAAEGTRGSVRALSLELVPLHGGVASMQLQGPMPVPLLL